MGYFLDSVKQMIVAPIAQMQFRSLEFPVIRIVTPQPDA